MTKKNKQNSKDITTLVEKLEEDKKQLEEELKKLKEVAAHTQAQYIDLKKDFDLYIERIKNQQEAIKQQIFIDIIKQLIPIFEQLRLSVENIPENLEDNQWAKGIKLVYENIKKFLETKGVVIEDSIGKEFNLEKHEPIGYEQVNDDKKNKIIKEHSKVYIYQKDGQTQVISPAKVIIGK